MEHPSFPGLRRIPRWVSGGRPILPGPYHTRTSQRPSTPSPSAVRCLRMCMREPSDIAPAVDTADVDGERRTRVGRHRHWLRESATCPGSRIPACVVPNAPRQHKSVVTVRPHVAPLRREALATDYGLSFIPRLFVVSDLSGAYGTFVSVGVPHKHQRTQFSAARNKTPQI